MLLVCTALLPQRSDRHLVLLRPALRRLCPGRTLVRPEGSTGPGFGVRDDPMSTPAARNEPVQAVQPQTRSMDGLCDPRGQGNLLDEFTEDVVDRIEMIGEETAGNLRKHAHTVSPGIRYLHCSRTIHQL